MKKASSIVLLIAGILAIVGILLWFALSILFYATGGFLAAVYNGTIPAEEVPQQIWDIANAVIGDRSFATANEALVFLFGRASMFLLFAIFSIPAAILSFSARSKESKGLYICCIVFGVLSSTFLPLVGGILGLIALGIENKNKEEAEKTEAPKAEEPKPEEPKAVEAPKEEAPVEEPKAEEPAPEEKPEEPQIEEPKVEE